MAETGNEKWTPNGWIPALPKKTVQVVPNPNADGHADNWVCEHIEMQTGTAAGEVWLCEPCSAAQDSGAAVVKVKAAGK